jgi:hypothetical protein
MRQVDEHKLLREVQVALAKPAFGTRTQAFYGIVLIALGALGLVLAILMARKAAINEFSIIGLGGMGGFFTGLGAAFCIGARHMSVIAPHISLESIQMRIEELES